MEWTNLCRQRRCQRRLAPGAELGCRGDAGGVGLSIVSMIVTDANPPPPSFIGEIHLSLHWWRRSRAWISTVARRAVGRGTGALHINGGHTARGARGRRSSPTRPGAELPATCGGACAVASSQAKSGARRLRAAASRGFPHVGC